MGEMTRLAAPIVVSSVRVRIRDAAGIADGGGFRMRIERRNER